MGAIGRCTSRGVGCARQQPAEAEPPEPLDVRLRKHVHLGTAHAARASPRLRARLAILRVLVCPRIVRRLRRVGGGRGLPLRRSTRIFISHSARRRLRLPPRSRLLPARRSRSAAGPPARLRRPRRRRAARAAAAAGAPRVPPPPAAPFPALAALAACGPARRRLRPAWSGLGLG